MTFSTALVTGASSGIGRGLALALAKQGTRVYAAARRKDELASLVDEIGRAGGRAQAMVLDVGDGERTYETVQALDRRDPLDLVVANAGIGDNTPAQSASFESIKRIIDVNVLGAIATLQAAIPGMVERRRGHLVGVSSLAAWRGLPRFSAYSASKAALQIWLESVRVDLHGTGVNVTTVCPGFVKTPMTAKNGKMPFLVELDDAVKEILQALRKQQAVCSFPLPMATAMRVVSNLPDSVYDSLVTRVKAPY